MVEIYRSPDGDRDRDVGRLTDGAAVVSPHAFPDVALTPTEIFA